MDSDSLENIEDGWWNSPFGNPHLYSDLPPTSQWVCRLLQNTTTEQWLLQVKISHNLYNFPRFYLPLLMIIEAHQLCSLLISRRHPPASNQHIVALKNVSFVDCLRKHLLERSGLENMAGGRVDAHLKRLILRVMHAIPYEKSRSKEMRTITRDLYKSFNDDATWRTELYKWAMEQKTVLIRGAHCAMYLATQGTMRREGASYDTEAGAIHWVQNFILGELKLWVHSFKDNSAEKTLSPIEILTTAEALEQEENEMDIGGKSQREGHLGNGITENLAVTTTKRLRGRPKKNSLPILPFNNTEAGIVTRSHAGKPGLLGKIGEVQSKVAVTKSPVKKYQARPKKPYVDSREKRTSSKTIGRPSYDDHNKSEGETEISAPESKEVTPISKRKKEKGSLNSKKANKPPGLSQNHFSEGGGSGEYQIIKPRHLHDSSHGLPSKEKSHLLPLIHSIGRYKIEDTRRVEKFFECLRNPKVVVDEEELDKALRDLDIDSAAMQYVFKRYHLIQNDLDSNAVASNDDDRLKFANIYRYLKKLEKRKQTI